MAQKIAFSLEIKGIDGQVQALNKIEKELKKVTASRNELIKTQKTENGLTEQETKKLTALTKEQIRLKNEKQKAVKVTKDNIRGIQALKGSYTQVSAAMSTNLVKWKNLSAAERANDKVGGKLLKTIKKQDAALKKLDTQVGKSGRNVGNYTGALKGVAGALLGGLGVTAGVTAFVSVLKSSFGIITAFGQANATLAATLGKTRDEINDLTESAIAYGKTTKFTAVEVSGLQNELAKLGFTTQEIKLQTNAVLNLAEATGADLSAAAKVTGVALKAYGLSAADSGDAVATLAIATTKSALSFADYETVLSTVGPVAASFGFSLADTIALMGKLKDAGFDSSKASTALKNILLNLADSNGVLAQRLGGSVNTIEDLIPALAKLKGEGVSLNETLQLTDTRSVAAFNTLLEGADDVLTLKDAIEGANDALDEMVATKTDNTIDAMTRMGSAWDGVVLTFRESDGFFTTFFDTISNFMNSLTDEYVSGFDKYVSLWSVGLINLGAKGITERKKTVDELNKLDEIDLYNWVSFNKDKKTSTDKFERDLYQIAVERLAAIEEARQLADERKIDAAKITNKAIEDEAAKTAKILADISDVTRRKDYDELQKEYNLKLEIAQQNLEYLEQVLEKEEAIAQAKYDQAIKEDFTLGEDEEIEDEVTTIADDPESQRLAALQQFTADLFAKTTDDRQVELDKQLDALNRNFNDGLISEKDYAEKRKAIIMKLGTARQKLEELVGKNVLTIAETTFDATMAIADRESAAYKAAAIGKAIIGTSLGIIGALDEQPAWLGIALAAIIGAMGAVNIAKIAGVKFEDGGEIKGASHANGGVPFSIAGQSGFEAEGGEVMFSNKAADYWGRSNLLEMNAKGNTYESGGFVANASQRTQELSDESVDRLINGINDKAVINDPVEALQAQNEAILIEQNGDI